jgi:DNA mismatch endonuclease (patch repair protein)
MDRIDAQRRSWNMGRIKGRDTGPEKTVRSLLHRQGFRFRLHEKKLPGKPDIVLPKWKAAIFVHGCFWHRHKNCRFCYTPKSNTAFWNAKFAGNVERDQRNQTSLREAGWKVLTVWECELADEEVLSRDLSRAIKGPLKAAGRQRTA